METKDFEFYRDLLKTKSGLVVKPDKAYLLDSRLSPVAKKWDFADIDEMTAKIRISKDPKVIDDIIEAMTTNETSFFRDTHPFDTFRDHMIPALTDANKIGKSIKIWCAACSSGQEPYSLQMVMNEDPLKGKLAGFQVSIDATDISNDILEQAKRGVYSQFEVQRGLPIQLLMNNFEQEGEDWKLKEEVKKNIRFSYFNLLDSMSALGKYDIIFCRNVLIYFDEKDKKDILERMAQQLNPHGFLMLGGAETVLGITDAFKLKSGVRGLYVLQNYEEASKGSPAPTPSTSAASA